MKNVLQGHSMYVEHTAFASTVVIVACKDAIKLSEALSTSQANKGEYFILHATERAPNHPAVQKC
jgi:hypothetical protein